MTASSPPLLVQRWPWALAISAALLLVAGWLAIARTEDLTDGSGRFLRQQVMWSVVAAAAVAIAASCPYQAVGRHSYAIFFGCLLLLVAVYLFPSVNGARRWVRFGPVGLQPSEFAKVGYVLALARYLMYRNSYRRLSGMLAPLALTLVPLILVLKEPDLGTSLVFVPVFFLMLFAAGAGIRNLAVLALCGVLISPIVWGQMSREQRSRVTALWETVEPGSKPSEDAYHLYQARQMLALGGAGGSLLDGEPVDDRTVYRVPEPHTDSILTIVVERCGLWGASLLLLAYAVLVWRGLAVADRTREPYGRLIVVGLMGLFAVEVLINAGMIVGLLPVTGLSLPLVSYGGSGLVAHCLAIGLVINVALRPGFEVTNEPFA